MSKNLYKQLAVDSPSLGSTVYKSALDLALTRCKNPDLIIDCTDGEFNESISECKEMRKRRLKYNKKTIWVLTKRCCDAKIEAIDPTYKKKMIKLH